MKEEVVIIQAIQCPICPRLYMFDKSPVLMPMHIFSYSHSATCWQQEVKCFAL